MCVLCQTVQDFQRALPPLCPKCKAQGQWRSIAPTILVPVAYAVTHNDRRFLKSLHIDPDE